MKETGDENPESSDSADPAEAESAGGIQEADDEDAEPDARNDVRFDVAVETVNTVGGDVGPAVTPLAQNIYENREHWKIQIDRWKDVLEKKFGKND